MTRVHRFDAGDLAPAERLPNGWLRCEGRVARTGILEYANADGTTRRELVLPEELFGSTSTDTLRMVPVTLTHPAQLLDANDVRAHEVGSVGENFRADAEYLVAPMMVRDAEAVRAVEGGNTGLSCGYDCTIDPPDPALVAKWGEHDGIQRRRVYNHLAIGVVPRAGDGARIRLDAAGNVIVAMQQDPTYAATQHEIAAPHKTENTMPQTIRLDGHSYGADDPALQQAIDRLITSARTDAQNATEAAAKVAEAFEEQKARLDSYQGRVSAWGKRLRARLDAMKARMVPCDECGGSGMVPADAEQADAYAEDARKDMAKCAYCDGSGKVRMHDAIKAMAPAPDADDESPDEDVAAMEDDLSGEPAYEEEQEQAANPAHDDPKDDAKRKDKAKRADARKAARTKRADSLSRMADRRARSRAALLTVAGQHLDAGDLAKKPDAEIRRAVVAKLAPHMDAAKMDDRAVAVLFASETKRAQGATPSPSAQLTQAMLPATARVDSRAAAHRQAVEAADRAMYPWKYSTTETAK